MNRLPRIVAIVPVLLPFLLSWSVNSANGQFQEIGPATDYVSWKATLVPAVVRPGGRVFAVFEAEITGDWKMYALDSSLPSTESVLSRPFGVKFDWTSLPEGVTFSGTESQATPEEGYDDQFKLTLKYFHEKARFAAELIVSPDAGNGSRELETTVQYQICNDELGVCLNRVNVPIAFSIDVDAGCIGNGCTASPDFLTGFEVPLAASSDDAGRVGGSILLSATDFEQSRSGGFWAFLLLAMGAGFASLLTPCVFPMIPLTVSYFTKHAGNRPQAVRMASIFGGSIIVTFTGIGIIAAVVVGAAGALRIASNPWVNLFIAIVLVGFALSLLGLYELRLPSGLINYFNRKGSEGSGLGGALFMGLTLTLVSFSCTAPFVGGLLAAASGGTWVYPLLGMVVYSAAFALPFILLALFPNALNALPRSGSWMNVLKVVLGFVELAAAVKFLSNADLLWGWGLISRPLGIAFVLVVFLLAGLYLLGKLRFDYEAPVESIGVGRMLGAMVFFVVALYLLPGLLGAPLNRLDAYLPPRQGTDVSILSLFTMSGQPGSASIDDGWVVDEIDIAFDEASERDLPILIDFSGYTCTNCREMESNVFPRPQIRERFEADFVLLRLYTDGLDRGDEFSRFQLVLTGTVALPTYAIVEPKERRVLAKRSGMMDVDEFAAFLDVGAAGYSRMASSE